MDLNNKSSYVSWQYRLVARHNVVVPFKHEDFQSVFRETLLKVSVWWLINAFILLTIGLYWVYSLGYVDVPDPRVGTFISYMAYVSGTIVFMALFMTLIMGIMRFTKFVSGVFNPRQ